MKRFWSIVILLVVTKPIIAYFKANFQGNSATAQSQPTQPKLIEPSTDEPWVDPHNPFTIRLDPNDLTLDLWRERRDFSQDKRPAGPVIVQRYKNVQRYKMGHVSTGIPTFFINPL